MQGGIADIFVSGAMFCLMFAMGLTLIGDDFRRIARAPRPTVVGTILQLMVMPLIGITIARIYDLPPLLTAGMVVLSACPGGMFSNMFVHVARGHTALSVTLTATATLVTLFSLPIWIQIALVDAEGAAAETAIDMPILETALSLGMLTVLPIGLGMLLRRERPAALRWEPRLARISVAVICLGVLANGASQPEPPVEEFMASIVPVAWYTLAVLALGILSPILFKISARDGATIGVELIVKNTLLGLVLLTQAVDFVAVVPIFVYMIVQTPLGIAFLVGWRMLAKRGIVEALPERPVVDDASGESPESAEPPDSAEPA